MQKQQHEKLCQKIQELFDVSPTRERMEQEVALLLMRNDVAEELDRLQMHLNEISSIVSSSEAMQKTQDGKQGQTSQGKKLDFLIQELAREANTLSVKVTDLEASKQAVDMKLLVEQMREQVQNIE